MISFTGAVKLGFQRYFDFSGRSTRAEYWWWVLFGFLAAVVLTIVDNIMGTNGVLAGLWGLATLIPGLTVTVRRLHDINKSGWWLLLGLLSWLIIPFIVLLIWFIRPSYDEANRQGPGAYVIVGSIVGFIVGIVFSQWLSDAPFIGPWLYSPYGIYEGFKYETAFGYFSIHNLFLYIPILFHLIIYSACIFAGAKIGRWAYRKTGN